jgi:hypothetical protein
MACFAHFLSSAPQRSCTGCTPTRPPGNPVRRGSGPCQRARHTSAVLQRYLITSAGGEWDGRVKSRGVILPPVISYGSLPLRMDNVWFCKLLLMHTRPTLEYRSTSEVLFLCWNSTKAQESRSYFLDYAYLSYFTYFGFLCILCIFCIFCIL